MKAKPRGPKCRNLTARGGVIYYERWLESATLRWFAASAELRRGTLAPA